MYIKISNWIKRESKIKYSAPFKTIPSDDITRARSIHNDVLKEIKYVSDKKNYDKREFWATTDETNEKGSGDCEDIAFIMMRRLIEAGYSRKDLCIICIEDHAFAGLYFNEKDFWVFDNGHITQIVKKASYILPLKNKKPLVGFNFEDIWSY